MINYRNGMYYVTDKFGYLRMFKTKKDAISYLNYSHDPYIPPTKEEILKEKQEIRKSKLERLKLVFDN